MKPQALVVFLILAALSAAVWIAFRADDAPAPSHLGGDAATPSAVTAPDRAASGELPTHTPAAAEPTDAAAMRTAADGSTRTDATVAEVAFVRGRIVDEAHEPRVQLPLQVSVWSGDPNGFRLDGRGSDKRELTTDADGRFAVALRGPGEVAFSLPDDDLVFVGESRFACEGSDRELGDLQVVRAGVLAGIVRDAAGQPAEGVMVEATLGPLGIASSSRTRTGPDGHFEVGKLRPGKWNLRTASCRFLPHSEQIDVAAGQRREDLVLTLEAGRSISGRVFDDRGVPVAGARVGSRRMESVGGVDIQRFSPDEAATTDANGAFTLAGLTEKTVTLRVSRKGYATKTVPNIATDSGNIELRLDRLASISGVLVSTTGSPLAGSEVRARSESGKERLIGGASDLALVSASGASATTDEGGRFTIEGVKPGAISLTAEGKAHLPVAQSGLHLVAGQRLENVRLVAEVGAVARVEVVDEAGRPIEGASVKIGSAPRADMPGMRLRIEEDGPGIPSGVFAGRARVFGSGKTGRDGIATIAGLPPGDAVASATHPDYAPSNRQPLVLPRAGRVEHRLVLGVPGFVAVQVRNPDGSVVAGVDVALRRSKSDRDEDRRATDADGRVRFGPLAGGSYEVMLVREATPQQFGGAMVFVGESGAVIESSRQVVTVVAGETAELVLCYPILTRLSGRVIGSDGPLAGGVVELDRAEDGVEISGLSGRRVKTDADGVYHFDGVESGLYLLRYGKPDQVVKARQEVRVPPGVPTFEQDLLLRTGSVRVQVLARDDGEPVEHAEVQLQRVSEGGKPKREQRSIVMVSMTVDGDGGEESSMMTFGQERVRTDANGVALFEDVPVGTYTLVVKSRTHAAGERRDVAVIERQRTDCGTLELTGAGQIRGKVVDATGNAVAAIVERRAVGTERWEEPEVALEGHYRMRGVGPGRYELRARAMAEQGSYSEPVVVEVVAGRTAVQDLTLPN